MSSPHEVSFQYTSTGNVDATLKGLCKTLFNVSTLSRCHNVGITLPQRCYNVTFNVAKTLSNDAGKTFISKELITSKQPIFRRCDNVVTALLCLLKMVWN